MQRLLVLVPIALLGAVGCSVEEAPVAVDPTATIALDDAVYAGEIVLRVEAALFPSGSAVTLAIVMPGRDTPLLARSYDLGDPIWRFDRDGARLYFTIDGRDAWPGFTAPVRHEMELVARFDPDGNPATDEPGSRSVRLPVRTGSSSLQVEIAFAHSVAANASQNVDEHVSDR